MARNSIALTEAIAELVERQTPAGLVAFTVDRSLICRFHEIAMRGDSGAGQIRQTDNWVGRGVVLFQPPPWIEVESHLEQAFEYLQRALQQGNGLHAAAYALWRLNWIHPFHDGNGRTARAVAYAILGVWLGGVPGTPTVPEQISFNRYPYWDALKAADLAWKNGEVDVSAMETLLYELLEKQISTAFT